MIENFVARYRWGSVLILWAYVLTLPRRIARDMGSSLRKPLFPALSTCVIPLEEDVEGRLLNLAQKDCSLLRLEQCGFLSNVRSVEGKVLYAFDCAGFLSLYN